MITIFGLFCSFKLLGLGATARVISVMRQLDYLKPLCHLSAIAGSKCKLLETSANCNWKLGQEIEHKDGLGLGSSYMEHQKGINV